MGGLPRLRKTVVRRAQALALERLTSAPAVAISGPRAAGKSTVLAALGATLGRPVLDLDEPAVQRAVRADPLRFLDTPRPVLIDEFARVPETLDVIKQLLNRNGEPGQFLLAGSTRYGSVPSIAQSLTGRIELLALSPLSQGEQASVHEAFLADLIARREPDLAELDVDRAEYASRVVAGGMPMALRLPTAPARARWFDQYLQLTLDKDVAELAKVRRRIVMPRLAAAIAARTGQLLNVTDVARDLDLDRSSTEDYCRLLEAVFLHQVLPAWGTTLLARSAATPKVHFLDTGLAARLMRVTPEKLLAARPSALQQFGHLLETFVVQELVRQAGWLEEPVTLGHWRTHDGVEVDLVVERSDGSVLAIEVKAAPDVRAEDLRGIQALSRRLGTDQVTGIVLHTARAGWRAADNVFALPIARLWQPRRE